MNTRISRSKNTLIQPVLIKVLPSGVGVYLSPFKDVVGSRIILAGPSKVFTRPTRSSKGNRAMQYTLFTTQISWVNLLIIMLMGSLGLILIVR